MSLEKRVAEVEEKELMKIIEQCFREDCPVHFWQECDAVEIIAKAIIAKFSQRSGK